MEVSYLGHSSFKIRGKNATLVTDPYSSEMLGLKFPKVEADMVTISHAHEDHNKKEEVEGSPFVIFAPGEYEVKGVSVFGIASFHDSSAGAERGPNTIYLIEMDGLRICHLGDLGHKLSDSQLEELDGVDILLLPVGGTYTLGPKEASEVISQLEPKIVIPMHYRPPKADQAVLEKLAELSEFTKQMGEKVQVLPKLQVIQDQLPEEMQIIVLERKNG